MQATRTGIKRNCAVFLFTAALLSSAISLDAQVLIKDQQCPDWQNDKLCKFLAANYDEARASCGILVSKSLLRFWKGYQQIDAVPNEIFYGIDRCAFPNQSNSTPTQSNSTPTCNGAPIIAWNETDQASLIRLLTTVFPSKDAFSAGWISQISNPAANFPTLAIDPSLSPNIYLRKGETNLVHSISCADVSRAIQSAKLGISTANANDKITARSDTSNRYRFVYGLFDSPMSSLRGSPVDLQAYYFEAADYYLDQMRPLGSSPEEPPQGWYVPAVRAVVAYDTFRMQTSLATELSASGSYSVPIFSISAEGSTSQQNNGSLSKDEFHVLVGANNTLAPLPDWKTAAAYFSRPNGWRKIAEPTFDSSSNKVTVKIAVDGMIGKLCQPGVWRTVPQRNTPGTCNDDSGFTTGTPFGIDEVSPVTQVVTTSDAKGTHRTGANYCQFTLSRYVGQLNQRIDLDGSFEGSLTPNQNQPSCVLRIPIDVSKSLAGPSLSLHLLDIPTRRAWFALSNADYIDKGAEPDISGASVTCDNAVGSIADGSIVTTAPGTGGVAATPVTGTYLLVDFTANGSPSQCKLSGVIKLEILGDQGTAQVRVN